ncbi:SCO2322 family protein [Streptomyces sp. H27-S2]|uniref:SCO2322 family protein n=1 Tax=Streptomyces antarcticus TaxID=2996458 RepID=UPI00226E0AFE|nr:SCO2322 family protein [Streptomyces sp. H27-S2]MCY0954094.1 SCO2322 family protein [Streptomyces sp. H27-S2]
MRRRPPPHPTGPEGHRSRGPVPGRPAGRRGPAARVLAFALALGTVLSLLAAGPALAAGYRYWSFWDGAGGPWAYATQGPSLARPADGSVQGFRFAVSKDAADQAARPRSPADFAAVCGSTDPVAGRKRVALVVDFGVPADAPAGDAPPQDAPRTACAQVAPDATTAEALAAVAKPLRYNSAALLCAISGYPKQGCGEPMADAPAATGSPSAAPSSTTSSSTASPGGGPSAGLLAGIAAVAALAAAGVWQSRRRNR